MTKLKYAMKIYDKKKLQSQGKLRWVEKEIELLKQISHPNIVKIIDSFETRNSINLIMEHIDAKPLSTLLSSYSNKTLLENDIRHIIKQVLEALDYLH